MHTPYRYYKRHKNRKSDKIMWYVNDVIERVIEIKWDGEWLYEWKLWILHIMVAKKNYTTLNECIVCGRSIEAY
jgi:hypothetical protein